MKYLRIKYDHQRSTKNEGGDSDDLEFSRADSEAPLIFLLEESEAIRAVSRDAGPAVIWFLVFSYIPMGGIILAFKQFNYRLGIFGSPWNGLTNYRFFFIGGAAWRITRNTILYNLAFIVFGNIMQLLVAISLSEMSHPK